MSEGAPAADWFSKPADSLLALLRRRGSTADDLAGHLEGGMATVRGLFDGSLRIDAARADALAQAVGGTREFWLKRQANYEDGLERAVQAAVMHIDEWLDAVPAPSGSRGRMATDAAIKEQLRRRMTFFNVSTLASWQERYGKLRAKTRFRTSASFDSIDSAVLLWLRRGELEADLIPTRPWSPNDLKERLDEIRKLSRISKPDRFMPGLRRLCAEAGVAVVVVKTPKGCHASGASRLVSADKAMMLLSFRHRSDDQFWFTVFHEIGHLLLHGASTFVDGDDTLEDDREREANGFASRCIVPEDRREEFDALAARRDPVLRFSRSVGVSPGLIVGQMQHRGTVGHNQLNPLKRRWTWEDIDPALV